MVEKRRSTSTDGGEFSPDARRRPRKVVRVDPGQNRATSAVADGINGNSSNRIRALSNSSRISVTPRAPSPSTLALEVAKTAMTDDNSQDTEEQQQQEESMAVDSEAAVLEEVDIPQTPPSVHANVRRCPDSAGTMKLDPTGSTKIFHASSSTIHSSNNGTPICNGTTTNTNDKELLECPPVTFHHYFPMLTDHPRLLTPTEKDALGFEWRVLFYPRGHGLDDEFVSVFVEMVLDPTTATDADSPSRSVEVEIVLVHQSGHAERNHSKTSSVHRFSPQSLEFGMTQFIQRRDVLNPENQFLTPEGRAEVEIRIISIATDDDGDIVTSDGGQPLYTATSLVAGTGTSATLGAVEAASAGTPLSSHHLIEYDSKKETGMVGLKNQGATCYLNSLLQTLFHLRAFRNVVYVTPTDKEDTNDSVSLALQRVFYRLQSQNKAVSTKELTRSFGWSQIDSFMQHDVQELYRILCDRLEEKMKHTKVDGAIMRLFEGKVRSFVQCVNVDFQSSRDESFYDLQLDVKGCKDIYASFRKYVEIEMLQGDNQYEAEGYGKQDAKKGIHFLHFPPVLNIQLKRFEYEPLRDGMVKIHDRFEFPKTLILDEFVPSSTDEKKRRTSDSKPTHVYHLHSVLVHSGDVHGGHYYVFIRPGKNIANSSTWFKFDDDQITRVDEQVAIQGSYGSSSSMSNDGGVSTSLYSSMLNSPDTAPSNNGIDFRAAVTTPEDDDRTGDLFEYNRSNGGDETASQLPGTNGANSLMLPMGRSFSSAYMLVYIRDGDNDIRCIQDGDGDCTKDVEMGATSPSTFELGASHGVTTDDLVIPEALVKRFHEEELATARRKKMQQTEHLYMNLRIASDWSIAKLKKITKNVDFSSFNNNNCLRIRIKRTASIRQLYRRIYLRTGVPVARQRLWKIITRENRTHRPDSAIGQDMLDWRVEALIDEDASPKSPVRLYLQIVADRTSHDDNIDMKETISRSVVNRYFWDEFSPPERDANSDDRAEDEDDPEEEEPTDATEGYISSGLSFKDGDYASNVKPNEILLFIKFYDIKKKLGERLEYMGNILIDMRKTGAELAKFLHEALQIPFTTELTLYEEIQPLNVSEIDMDISLGAADIQHGDIICYQYAEDAEAAHKTREFTDDEGDADMNAHTSDESMEELPVSSSTSSRSISKMAVKLAEERYPDVPSYFQYLLDRVEVVFQHYNHPEEEPFALVLLYSNVYDEIIDAVAAQLGLVGEKRLHLRLYQHSPLNGLPKRTPLRHSKYAGDDQTTLDEFLTEYMERTNIMYYEILPNPITEIEAKKQVTVYFSIYDECFVDPSAPKSSRRLEFLVLPTYAVKDLLVLVKQTFELPTDTPLRVCEVSHSGTMIQRILAEDTPLDKYWSTSAGYSAANETSLFVEQIPTDELEEEARARADEADRVAVRMVDGDDVEDDDESNEFFRLGVVHFNFQPNTPLWINPHGVPFVTYFRELDTVAHVKERLRKRIGVSEEMFSRWNLAFVKDTKASTLKSVYDDMELEAIDGFTMGKLEEICGDQFESIANLGLEHADPKPVPPKYGRRQEHGIRIRQN